MKPPREWFKKLEYGIRTPGALRYFEKLIAEIRVDALDWIAGDLEMKFTTEPIPYQVFAEIRRIAREIERNQ